MRRKMAGQVTTGRNVSSAVGNSPQVTDNIYFLYEFLWKDNRRYPDIDFNKQIALKIFVFPDPFIPIKTDKLASGLKPVFIQDLNPLISIFLIWTFIR